MATEVLVGIIGFGTAAVGLVTAYLSRTRHIVHRHEFSEFPKPEENHSVWTLDDSQQHDKTEAVPPCKEADAPDCQEVGGNKYGLAALRAVELHRTARSKMSILQAWEVATTELFGTGTAAQQKGCPKGAFLGLCQAGYVVGVPSGEYTQSKKNRDYAVTAAELLSREPKLASQLPELWRRVLNGVNKQHNSQMHVVITLWRNGLLATSSRGA